MIEKNDILCAIAEGIGSNGEGIIKHEGITFFVPACLPGEKVRFKVLKVKGSSRLPYRGNSTSKVFQPSAHSTRTSPEWRVTMRLTMARPMPLPSPEWDSST